MLGQPSDRLSPLARELGKSRPFDSAEQEAYLNLRRTASVVNAEFEQLFRPLSLSEATYNALRILRGVGAVGCPCSRIAENLVARVPDVTRLVDRLEAAGLAERTRVSTDRRVVQVKITQAGLDQLAKLDEPVLDLHARQLGHLTKAELKTLSALLVKARERPGTGDQSAKQAT